MPYLLPARVQETEEKRGQEGEMNKREWQQFACKAWGWSYDFAGKQYDLVTSGYRGADLHDNAITLLDSQR
jgi:hypothetical protein